MYDGEKIIPGLIVFIIFITFPIWFNHFDAGAKPNPEKPANATKQCVEETQYMRSSHMVMLNEWRDDVLRRGNRDKVKAGDMLVDRSLMNGCIATCHTNKKKFCDECHQYTSVKPYCWDCHYVPKETL